MTLPLDETDEAPRGPTMRPASRIQTRVASAAVAAIVGLLVGVQVRQFDERGGRLAAESPEDLTQILADLNAEADGLTAQVIELQQRLFEYRRSAGRGNLALADTREALADLQVLAGTTAVGGPGLAVTISDTRARVPWDAALDLVQELRDAGAEALTVGGHRVVASTWFGPADPGITVDGRVVLPPYRIQAIVPTDDMHQALQIPGGPVTLIAAQPGVNVATVEVTGLILPPVRGDIGFRHARPA
jgi:uncharacterized protein YlxW (UPF0749 family)